MTDIEGADLFVYEYCALFSGNMLFLWQDGVVKVDLERDGKCSLHNSMHITPLRLGEQQWYLG